MAGPTGNDTCNTSRPHLRRIPRSRRPLPRAATTYCGQDRRKDQDHTCRRHPLPRSGGRLCQDPHAPRRIPQKQDDELVRTRPGPDPIRKDAPQLYPECSASHAHRPIRKGQPPLRPPIRRPGPREQSRLCETQGGVRAVSLLYQRRIASLRPRLPLERLLHHRVANKLRKPIGIDRRRPGEHVERRELIGGEMELGRGEIVVELLRLRRADDHTRHDLLRKQPGDRRLRDAGFPAGAAAPRYLPQFLDKLEPMFFIKRHDIETGKAVVLLREALARILPAQESTHERAPNRQAEPIPLHYRDHVAFDIADQQRIVHLTVRERRPAVGLLYLHGRRDAPRAPIREPEIAGLAGTHHLVERRERLLEWRVRVLAVSDIKIDVVGTQPAQALIDGPKDMPPVQPRLYQAGARSVTHLRGDHQLLPATRKRLAEHGLRLAAGIGIRGIEKIDGRIEGPPHHGVGVVGLRLINSAYRFISRSEGHGPKREPRHDQTSVTQDSVLHRIILAANLLLPSRRQRYRAHFFAGTYRCYSQTMTRSPIRPSPRKSGPDTLLNLRRLFVKVL